MKLHTAIVALPFIALGCTTGGNNQPTITRLPGNGGPTSHAGFGSITDSITLSAGVFVRQLDFEIDNGGPPITGKVDLSFSNTAEFTQGDIPDGTGYAVTITGQDTVGDDCYGKSGLLTVNADQVTPCGMIVTCHSQTDASIAPDVTTGSIGVDAGVVIAYQAPYQCPGVTNFTINPAEVITGYLGNLQGNPPVNADGGTPTMTWTINDCFGPDGGSYMSSMFGYGQGGAYLGPVNNPNINGMPQQGNGLILTGAYATTFDCNQYGFTTPPAQCSVTYSVGLIGTNALDGGALLDDAGNPINVCQGVVGTSMTGNFNCDPAIDGGDDGAAYQPPACTGQTYCEPGFLDLAGVNTAVGCYDTTSDPNNCGACATPCMAGQSCTSSVCH